MTKQQRDWFPDKEFRKKLIKEFEKAGLPLEYKARKIFEKK